MRGRVAGCGLRVAGSGCGLRVLRIGYEMSGSGFGLLERQVHGFCGSGFQPRSLSLRLACDELSRAEAAPRGVWVQYGLPDKRIKDSRFLKSLTMARHAAQAPALAKRPPQFVIVIRQSSFVSVAGCGVGIRDLRPARSGVLGSGVQVSTQPLIDSCSYPPWETGRSVK